jgi:two-component system CheB/CheR fusion protein
VRILVVDDLQAAVTSQVTLLRMHGYEADGCDCGADAMDAIERLRPDVVLLDLGMPQMSGYDVAEELRDNPDLRPKCLVALTGYGHDSDREHTRRAGFDFHLLKPVAWNELKTLLDHCCDSLTCEPSAKPR